MHEYHIVEGLVKQLLEIAKANKAKRVTVANLVMGKASGFSEESVRLYFETITKGTIAEGARLTIKIKEQDEPGRGLYVEDIEVEPE